MPSNVPTSLAIPPPKNPELRSPWARAPPPSAKHTNGNRWRIARSMMRSIFEWLMPVCVPPHTRVVVGRDGDALAVQRPEPGDETTGRLVLGAGQHAGLDERAGVDDGVDALAGGQPPALVDLGDRLGTGIVVGPRPLGVQLLDRLVVQRDYLQS